MSGRIKGSLGLTQKDKENYMAEKKTIKLDTISDVFMELSIKQAGKLIKAIAAYNYGQNYSTYLDEYLRPIFLLLI